MITSGESTIANFEVSVLEVADEILVVLAIDTFAVEGKRDQRFCTANQARALTRHTT